MFLPIPGSAELLSAIKTALGPERKPLLIGLDGRWGAGKSSLASWLAWQLGMPSVHLDLYIVRNCSPLNWRYDDLERVLAARLNQQRPVIVEGICLCQALQQANRQPDFLVWVENKGGRIHLQTSR